MELSKAKMKQIRRLMVLAAVLVLAVIYSKEVIAGVKFVFGIFSPFIVGGIMAFILNLPMRFYETTLFKRWRGKAADKLKRPICMIMSLISVVLILAVVIGTVVPQVTATVGMLGSKIPAFTEKTIDELVQLTKDYPELAEYVVKLDKMQVNWDTVLDGIINFLKNGVSNVLNSTVSVASSIISSVMNGVISFIFALYILSQKEKLSEQGKRIISAYMSRRAASNVLKVCSMLHKNFSNFIAGQCVEAVILGTLFVVFMSIFRMPYAFMIGVLIAFTALIPIVGAFIGCAVGAFLILIENPMLALWFVVLFLIIQQIEGNLIYPKVVGNSVGLPSIWVLMAVSVGGSLFGVAGMLFFIPLMSTFYALLRESVNNRNRGKEISGLEATAADGRETVAAAEVTSEQSENVTETSVNAEESETKSVEVNVTES